MPINTPAMITYTPPGGVLQTIRFHSVISEDHSASSQITKFPVQTGFEISNNSIRQNRTINIEAIISNHLIAGGATAYEYTSNNSKTIFEALESLVNSGQPCEVITNLGIYNPVVFTKFKTKQMAGWTDAIKFNISGEEVQVSSAVNGTAPAVLSFKILTGAEADARYNILRNTGIEMCDCNEISEARMKLGEDFAIESRNEFGNKVTTTYICKGKDDTTDAYIYDIHVSDTKVFAPGYGSNVTGSPLPLPTSGGVKGVGDCLQRAAEDVVEEAATDLIITAMGELKKSIYGALYDTVHMVQNEYGQLLVSDGIGCMVRGVTNFISDYTPYQPGESLPTTDDILNGAKKFGSKLLGNEEEESTEVITQLKCCETG